jgi:threonine synthase
MKGLAKDGGLYMPEKIGQISRELMEKLENGELEGTPVDILQEIAFEIAMVLMEGDVEPGTLKNIVKDALNFDAPLVDLNENVHALELFHGSTLAFKDFGARFLSRLMAHFSKGITKEITVLVATSGDTGSAVASGFLNVPGIRVVLLYPSGKVSKIQEQQLTTMGGNITALEVDGTFDDCQRLVKEAFVDSDLNKKLVLTSANSINIGRLLPQIFYYFYAYYQLKDKSKPVVISVPSGNFGNLTAGLIAKRMGLPVDRFIAAVNANDTFEKYLQTGEYTPQKSVETMSNAMDVGSPSNFTRIMELYDHDVEKVRTDIWSKSFSDEETSQAIREVHEKYNYLMDPHGAVAYLGLMEYQRANPGTNGIFFITAHPAKFADKVEPIIGSKIEIPERLAKALKRKKEAVKISSNFAGFKNFLYCFLSKKLQ